MSVNWSFNALPATLIQGLCHADAYNHAVESIQVRETHISWILLTGQYAYKIKKPVKFAFLDFSTLEQRQFYCAEEIRVNHRFSPQLYLEVVPITGTEQHPSVGGSGEVIEYAVRMQQFANELLLADLADACMLSSECCDQLPGLLAGIHRNLARINPGSVLGSSATVRKWVMENFTQLENLVSDAHSLAQLQRIRAFEAQSWETCAAVMQQRQQHGFVRECHGDLHLGNITLIDGRVVLFDAIEFNPELRWIDVMNDLAALVVDLLASGYANFAYRLLNDYLQHTADYAGLQVLRYYLVYRALVWAKVSLLRAGQAQSPEAKARAEQKFTAFMQLADTLIIPARPVLLLMHGYSGAGKSTYSRYLLEQLPAVRLRSDVERKRLFADLVGSARYSADADQQLYQHLVDMAEIILQAGFAVIVDATFLQRAQRDAFKNLAQRCKVPWRIIHLRTEESLLRQRINTRLALGDDVSEATPAVLQLQIHAAESLTPEERAYTLTLDSLCATAWPEMLAQVNALGQAYAQ